MQDESYYKDREQTYIKHYFLEKYLEKVAYKIGSFNEKFAFVDGFSGPWQTANEAFDDTSFMIAIRKLREVRLGLDKIGRKFDIKCVFVEKNPDAYDALLKAVDGITDINISTIHGEFESSIPRIIEEIKPRFTLTFVDPTGWTGYSLKHIKPILMYEPGEVIVNFMFDHIQRFVGHPDQQLLKSFDNLFGSKNWRETNRSELVEMYSAVLKAEGNYNYSTFTEIKKPLVDRAYFHLIYGTRHPAGIIEFRAAEKQSSKMQEVVRANAKNKRKQDRSGQVDLFGVDHDQNTIRFDEARNTNIAKMKSMLIDLLKTKGSANYLHAAAHSLCVPLVWESDFKDLLLSLQEESLIEILGMKENERRPKHRHKIKYLG